MKKFTALLFALIMLLSLVACGGGGDDQGEATGYKSEINIALDVDPETYNPIIFKNTTAQRVSELIYCGLVRLDNTLAIQPDLAESWDISEDGLTWTFNLRKGVLFSDGSACDSADVKYTYESILDENNNAPYRSRYTAITSIDTPDENTVVFNLATPNSALMVYCNLGIIPEGAMDIAGFDTAPIGAGPYKVESYEMNNKTVLKARDDYYGGKALTETINVFVINDNSVRLASLQSGDVDFVCSPLSANDLELVENDDSLVFNKVPGLGITYIGFNVADPIIGDLSVRQAIAMMVDKETISSVIYSNMDTPATTPILSFSWAADSSLHDYDYNKDKAVETLEAAGWVDSDGDGIREKNGVKLTFTLATHTDDTSRFQVVEFMQNQLESIGFEVDVSVTEWANFSQAMIDKSLQVWVAGWLNLYDPDRMFDMFHSSSGSNYGNFNNPEVDAALEDARHISDQAVRAADYVKVAQIATDDVWYVTMVEQAYVSIHTPKLTGYTVYPSGSIFTLWQSQVAE